MTLNYDKHRAVVVVSPHFVHTSPLIVPLLSHFDPLFRPPFVALSPPFVALYLIFKKTVHKLLNTKIFDMRPLVC